MEKILLDFGIDGKIKTINNGPVVSLYEFEPAPGVKVSKIIKEFLKIKCPISKAADQLNKFFRKNRINLAVDQRYFPLSSNKISKLNVMFSSAFGRQLEYYSGMVFRIDIKSNNHSVGRLANEAVEEARKNISNLINAETSEIIFTSGATESNNLAIKSIAKNYFDKNCQIISCKTEHKCVIESCHELEKEGFKVIIFDTLFG